MDCAVSASRAKASMPGLRLPNLSIVANLTPQTRATSTPRISRIIPEATMFRISKDTNTVIGLAIACTLAISIDVHAQADPSWIGMRVVQSEKDFELRSQHDAVIRNRGKPRIYHVMRIDDDGCRLWVTDVWEGPSGWALASDVILIDQALEFFTTQIRDHPQDAFYHAMRSTLWQEKNELDRGLLDLGEAIRLEPASPAYRSYRASFWSDKRKEYDKAIADFTEAIRLDPKLAYAYRGRGDAWSRKKEYDKAIADFTDAIRLDPKDFVAYSRRAWIWATCADPKIRDGKQALASATKACELTAWKGATRTRDFGRGLCRAGQFRIRFEVADRGHRSLFRSEGSGRRRALAHPVSAKEALSRMTITGTLAARRFRAKSKSAEFNRRRPGRRRAGWEVILVTSKSPAESPPLLSSPTGIAPTPSWAVCSPILNQAANPSLGVIGNTYLGRDGAQRIGLISSRSTASPKK